MSRSRPRLLAGVILLCCLVATAEADFRRLRNRRINRVQKPLKRAPLPKDPPGTQFQPVPLFVMMPLDTIDPINNTILDPKMLRESLLELKKAGVAGVMADVWWGVVEKEGPHQYDWKGYDELVQIVTDIGLQLQAVMSFHQCGGNVGDSCYIPLPPWVLKVGETNHDIFYTDMHLNRNREYLSLGVDNEKLFHGRSPLDIYQDFLQSFADRYREFIPDVIIEAQIGLGPAGEMRYPAYPLALWQFPGCGQFQCYDKYMRKDFTRAAIKAKQPDLALIWPPHPDEVGNYNYSAEHTQFFRDGGLWDSKEGDFFLEWYAGSLIKHGDRVLARAREAFKGTNILLASKVAGIHWQGKTLSHAPELTAGYYNTHRRDGYAPIAKMFAKHKTMFDFTCLEMDNEELPEWAKSNPEELVEKTKKAAVKCGCLYAGENALPRVDRVGFKQMQKQCVITPQRSIASFTYLRLGEHILDQEVNQGKNWFEFARFACEMRIGRQLESWSVPPLSKHSRRGEVPVLDVEHAESVERDALKEAKMWYFGRSISTPQNLNEVYNEDPEDVRRFEQGQPPFRGQGVQAGDMPGRHATVSSQNMAAFATASPKAGSTLTL